MNLGDMKLQFLGLLNRKDCTDALVSIFFNQAITRAQRTLRLPFMERVLDIDTSQADVDMVILPADWIETITFVTSERELENLDVGTFVRKRCQGGSATWYTRKFDRWIIKPPIPMGMDATLIYYGQEAPMVNPTDESSLAAVASDIIIYGALTFAATYFVDERGPGWETSYQGFCDEVQEQASDSELRNGSNQIEPAYTFCDET